MLATVMKAIDDTLMEGRGLSLDGLGQFYHKKRAGRTVKNPGNMGMSETVRVEPDSYPLRFRPSSNLKDQFKGKVPTIYVVTKANHPSAFKQKD